MNKTIYKLGSQVEDVASGLNGVVTMLQIDTENSVLYLVQPKGIKSNGEVLDAKWVVGGRLRGKESVKLDVPIEILLTTVKDKVTGFTGTATSLVYHLSGCIHVQFCSKEKKGAPSQTYDFSILRLEGSAIKKMNEEKKRQEMKEKPSPSTFCESIR